MSEKEDLLKAAQAADAVARDPSKSSSERARARADATRLTIALVGLGTKENTTPLTDAITNSSYYADSAKQGLVDWAYRVLDSNELSSRLIPSIFGIEPLERDQRFARDTLFGLGVDEEMKSLLEQHEIGRRQAIGDAASRWFGAGSPRAPKNNFERYGGIAIESITSDPILSFIGARGPVGIAFNVATAPAPAVAGAASYDVSKEAFQSFGMEEDTADMLAKTVATVAGFGAGMSTGFVPAGTSAVRAATRGTPDVPVRPSSGQLSEAGWAAPEAGMANPAGAAIWEASRRAADATRKLYEAQKVESALDKVNDFVVTSSMKEVVSDIVASDPASVIRAAETAKILAEAIPGFKIGAGILLADNAVVRKNMETLLKEAPLFRQSVEKTLEDASNALNARQAQIYGQASNAEIQKTVIETLKSGNYGVNLSAARKKTDQLQNNLDLIVDRVRSSETPLDVGKAATALVDNMFASVRKEQSAEYSRIINGYASQGVQFPAESVADLYGFVKTGLDANLFLNYPVLNSNLKKLEPKVKEIPPAQQSVAQFLTSTRTTPAAAQQLMEFDPLDLTQLDSLNKSLNAAIRSTGGVGPNYNLLKETKTRLNSLIQQVEGFGPEYIAINKSFYERVGIPIDSAGLAKVDSTALAEDVGVKLLKPSVASEFISFVGDSGIPVVRDSLLASLNKKIYLSDGTLNINAYNKFMRDNKDTIALVPGLAAQLSDVRTAFMETDRAVKTIESRHDEWVRSETNGYLQAVYKKGLNATITDMLTSPQKAFEYAQSLRSLDPVSIKVVQGGIRSALINKAFDSNQGAKTFIEQNKAVYDAWFGKTYSGNLTKLAQANDILSRVRPDRLSFAFSFREVDAAARATGSTTAQWTSVLRDRISSNFHKAAILTSRFFNSQAHKAKDAEMMRLLSDPDAVASLADAANMYSKNQIDIKDFSKKVGSIFVSRGIIGGVRGFEAAEVAETIPRPE